MKALKVLLIFILFPVFVMAQQTDVNKVYAQAITEYLTALNKTDKLTLDTLFVGPIDEEFEESIKDIDLPKEILKTKISKLKQVEGDRKVKYCKGFIFVNIIATLSKDQAKFLFVTFNVEKGASKANWYPKHNFNVNFNYDSQTKAYKLDKQNFEYLYPKR